MENFTKDQAYSWLKERGLAVSGTKEELLVRIGKYIRYPHLVKRLHARQNNKNIFVTNLSPLVIPPLNARWVADYESHPHINQEIFKYYCSNKIEESLAQQEKAYHMLQSRKIGNVKVIEPIPIQRKCMLRL